MNHSRFTYVLAGGGIASGAAVSAIRSRDSVGSILMVGQEINRPYARPPLSKAYLRHETRHEDLFTVGPDWLTQHHVELRTGLRVVHVDCPRSAAILSNGEEVAYERLLLAIGASPRRLNLPGADLPNLYYLRTLDDADRLGNAIAKAKAEGLAQPRGRGRVTVIGGGLLGVELAGTLTQLGLAVDLVMAHSHPWNRFAGETAGRFVGRRLAAGGVNVIASHRAIRVAGDGRVQRVVLDDESAFPCDFAVAAVGTLANRELVRGTSIVAENAILVDAHCRTAAENVYAAGDCAAVFDPLFGKHRILDHWDHAIATAKIAGTNMAGGATELSGLTGFSTESLDIKASVWGEPRLVARRIVRGGPSDAGFSEIGIASDGRATAVLTIGTVPEAESLKNLVATRAMIEPNQAERLKDPAIAIDAVRQ